MDEPNDDLTVYHASREARQRRDFHEKVQAELQAAQFSVLSDSDKKTIQEARRWIRYLWQQGFRIDLDAIEHDGLFELMRKLDDLYLRTTSQEPQLTGRRDV